MQRREFLRTAGGAAGATAAAGGAATPAAADGGLAALQEDGDETEQSEGEQPDTEEGEPTPGGQTETGDPSQEENPEGEDEEPTGATETVIVGPGGNTEFDPSSLEIPPNTTVVFEWDSPNHNVNPQSIPEGAEWEGHPDIVDDPNTYEHTFTTEGTYEYQCDPHAAGGMVGEIVVDSEATLGEGTEEVDPAHMGVLLQKHFIGAATFMGIFVTLVFTFYLLKYGESAHSSAPGKRD